MKKSILCLFIPLGILIGCSVLSTNDNEPQKVEALPRDLRSSEKKVVEADQAFSYELFQHTVKKDSTKNILISPLSISMALGMTLNGAAGETREGMKDALSLQDMTMENLNESYSSLIKLLQKADSKVDFKLGNLIWVRKGFPVEGQFKKTCKKFFEARIASLDFSSPSAADKINQCVKNNTEGLIDAVIKGNIPDEVVIYLINAIYFKGDWQSKFDAQKTQLKPFTLVDGSVADVEMMYQEHDFAAPVSDEVKMLDMRYGNSLFTMTLLMPGDEQVDINNFILNKVTPENMARWHDNLTTGKTKVYVPKFKMEYSIKLNETLKAMGMGQAFSKMEANFTNISKAGKLFLSKVKHKAFIEVDEEGTEAAAVTSVSAGVNSVGPGIRTIRFDRPFLFLIRERTSGTILFMGKMQNPLQ